MKTITKNEGRTEIVYQINEEKRVVTCIIKGCSFDLYRILAKYSGASGIDNIGNVLMDGRGKDSFMGWAVCSEEDEFDEEYGMRLAKSRAEQDRINYCNNKVRKVIDKLDHLADVLEEYGIRELPKSYGRETDDE